MKKSEQDLQSLLEKIDHKERKSRRRAIIYTLVPIFLAIVLLCIIGQQISKLNRYIETTDDARRTVRKDVEAWVSQLNDVITQMMNSNYDSAKQVLNELTDEFNAFEGKLEYFNAKLERSEFKQAKQVFQDTIKTKLDTLKKKIDIPTKKPLIYIHIQSKLQENKADKIREILKMKGCIVPEVDILVDKSPRITQVRYFKDDESVKKEGEKILAMLKSELGERNAILQFVRGYESSKQVRLREKYFEIWLGQVSEKTKKELEK